MPRRLISLSTGEFYHLFNRSIYRQPILVRKRDLDIFQQLMTYYTLVSPPTKFSYYRLNPDKYQLDYTKKLVTLVSYCYMPNHFHVSVRQDIDGGIQKYMQRVLNSFSHYQRIKYGRKGPLFESTFRNVHIETDEQLIHLSRYHHLNPVTAHMVEHPRNYLYSSYQIYWGKSSEVVNPTHVLDHFSSIKDYEKFVLDRKKYQRELDKLKHLIFD